MTNQVVLLLNIDQTIAPAATAPATVGPGQLRATVTTQRPAAVVAPDDLDVDFDPDPLTAKVRP